MRAIAVLSVIVFHAFPAWLPGGFVGVDIFFVISGFLIISIILKTDKPIGSFTKTFYERRIRRLIPPALPVIAFTLVAGLFLLSLNDLQEMANSVIAYATFVSNWFFLGQAGYFDGPSHFKPLLHTWSLSVEEQFYLFSPVIVLLAKPLGRRAMIGIFAATIIGSYMLGVHFLQTGQADSAFFNSFARFWQIAAGGLVAAFVWGGHGLTSKSLRSLIALIGFAMVVAAAIFITEETLFPSAMSLLAVMGPALIILAGTIPVRHKITDSIELSQTSNPEAQPLWNQLIGVKPMIGVGLISYALYLWHWPLLVYLNFWIANPTSLHLVAAIGLTFLLSILSYYLIETPVRAKRVFKSVKSVYFGFVVSTVIVIGSALLIVVWSTSSDRFEDGQDYEVERMTQFNDFANRAMRHECWVDHRVEFLPVVEKCLSIASDQTNILLIGDSHVAQLLPGFRNTFQNVSFSLLAVDSCFLEDEREDRHACLELNNWILTADLSQFDAVFYSSSTFITPITAVIGGSSLKIIAEKTPVYVFGPIQFYEPNMPTLYGQMVGSRTRSEMNNRFDEAVSDDQFIYDASIEAFINSVPNTHFVSLLDVTCPRERCRHFDGRGWPVLIDNSHMNVTTSEHVIRRIAPEFSGLMTLDMFESTTLLSKKSISGWEKVLKAGLAGNDNSLSVRLGPDGRIHRRFEWPKSELLTKLLFEATVTSELEEVQNVTFILQNGCTNIVEDGRSYEVAIKPGSQQISLSAQLGPLQDCGQIRMWSRGENIFEGTMADIKIELVSRVQ